LTGSGAVRHCGQCNAPVTNLSAMRPGDARRFVAAMTEPQCLAYRYRPDGTIIFADTLGRRRHPRALAVAGAAVLAAACSATGPESSDRICLEDTSERSAPVHEEPTPVFDRFMEAREDRLVTEQLDAEKRGEIPAARIQVDCATARQLFALGGYGGTLPKHCVDEASR
jgi:hypothetical protein